MLNRRALIACAVSAFAVPVCAQQPNDEIEFIEELKEIEFPPFEMIDPISQFGRYEPDLAIKKRAEEAWNSAPKGPKPISIADYFIDSFSTWSPDVITQWPQDDYWNPVIVEFFRSTNYKAENDMVPWCAAFVNWCLRRTNRLSSNSAASQSFLNADLFEQFTTEPTVGDLAIFTCYSVDTGKSVGLGHVAFVAEKPSTDRILLAGGNQTKNGTSMICRKYYSLKPLRTTRTISGKRTPVDMKFNTYVRIV